MADNFNILDFSSGGSPFVFDGAFVEQDSAQSIANNSLTQLTFGAATFDTNGYWNATSERMVIPAGVDRIMLDGKAELSSGLSGGRRFVIRKNGSNTTRWDQVFGSNHPGGANECSISFGPIPVVEGDFFELFFQQTTGGTADIVDKTFSLINVSGQ